MKTLVLLIFLSGCGMGLGQAISFATIFHNLKVMVLTTVNYMTLNSKRVQIVKLRGELKIFKNKSAREGNQRDKKCYKKIKRLKKSCR